VGRINHVLLLTEFRSRRRHVLLITQGGLAPDTTGWEGGRLACSCLAVIIETPTGCGSSTVLPRLEPEPPTGSTFHALAPPQGEPFPADGACPLSACPASAGDCGRLALACNQLRPGSGGEPPLTQAGDPLLA